MSSSRSSTFSGVPAAEEVAEARPARPAALPPGRLTRSQVARRLGVSVTTLRRMEGAQLHPEKGPGGVRLFDVAEVEAAFVRVRSVRQGPAGGDGETAAEVFALLDEGLNPVDVVRRTRVGPDLVEHLQGQWARMRRALVLLPEARTRLESALLGEVGFRSDGWTLKTAEELETALRTAAEPTECAMCHESSAFLCRRCSKEYAARSSSQAR